MNHSLEPADFQARAMPLRRLRLPSPGTVHLWFLDLDALGNPLRPPGGRPAGRPGPRQLRALRRFYLRLLLGAYLQVPGKDVSVLRQVRGKPVLAAPFRRQLDFSIANSDGCCLVGICTAGLVGVDLELAGRRAGDPLRLARRYFSPAEAEALAAQGSGRSDQAFLQTWACKEALVKVAGHGIANQLNRFTVSCDPDAPPVVLDMQDDSAAAWRLALVAPSSRHLGAIALRHEGMEIEPYRLTAPA